jgi:hypothetical protein
MGDRLKGISGGEKRRLAFASEVKTLKYTFKFADYLLFNKRLFAF